MMGKPLHREPKLFHIGFDLDGRVPADHVLRRVDRAVDFSFVRELVAARYGRNGHASLDPALVLRLLFLCFFENVRSERELMRQLPLRLDWLWFCRLDLDSPVPDHSVLSKARRRWGERAFEQVFAHVLHLCRAAGLVGGETSHADSTLLRASASLDGRVSRKLWEQLERHEDEHEHEQQRGQEQQQEEREREQEDLYRNDGDDEDDGDGDGDNVEPEKSKPKDKPSQKAKAKPKLKPKLKLNELLVSPVDPDAATSTRRKGGTTLGYRDHRLIDDHRGIILATVATAADVDDGAMLADLLERQQRYTDTLPAEAVGDSMYGTADNYRLLAEQGIRPYLKKRRGRLSPKVSSWLTLLPAGCSSARARYLLGRRKSRAEGSFAEAHVRMDHRRCRWRRRWRTQVQCSLVAAVQTLKKLAGLTPSGRRRACTHARAWRPWPADLATFAHRSRPLPALRTLVTMNWRWTSV